MIEKRYKLYKNTNFKLPARNGTPLLKQFIMHLIVSIIVDSILGEH